MSETKDIPQVSAMAAAQVEDAQEVDATLNGNFLSIFNFAHFKEDMQLVSYTSCGCVQIALSMFSYDSAGPSTPGNIIRPSSRTLANSSSTLEITKSAPSSPPIRPPTAIDPLSHVCVRIFIDHIPTQYFSITNSDDFGSTSSKERIPRTPYHKN